MQFGQSKSLKKTKNLESSSKVLKNQEQFSEETQKIVEQEVLKAKKELLDRLVSLEILNYSSYDEVYFVLKAENIYFISPKIELAEEKSVMIEENKEIFDE
jgi:hypothetical protein